jgi:hypothetical protein
MKTFIKTFSLITAIYFLSIFTTQMNSSGISQATNSVVYSDSGEDEEDSPDLPPITHSPVPCDTIIYLPDGDIIIIY